MKPAAEIDPLLADILDAEAIANIRSADSGDDDDLFRRYAEIFLSAAPALLERLGLGQLGEDCQVMAFAAHSLKSDSRAIGATTLADLAGSMEALARAGEFAEAAELLHAVRIEFERVKSALDAILHAA